MTAPSPSDPRPAPELAQVAPVAAHDAAVVRFGADFGRNTDFSMFCVVLPSGNLLRLGALRHGRLGFGLGGGLS